MKLTFESNLVFHQEAVKSITDLFYKSIANLLFRKDLKNSKVVGITTVKNSNVPESSCFLRIKNTF